MPLAQKIGQGNISGIILPYVEAQRSTKEMTCVAVATSPVLAASPSMRHRDDPRIFGDVRPSQGTPKLSPFFSSRKSSPSRSPMHPPPSPRVQCSPRTPSSCSCSSVASPSPGDLKWRPTSLEKRFNLEAQADGMYGSFSSISNVEPPSPRLTSKSPILRFSLASQPLLLPTDAPSPRFGGSHSIFESPRVFPVSRISIEEDLLQLADLPKDRSDGATGTSEPFLSASSNVSIDVSTPEVGPGRTARPISPPLKRKRPPKLEIPMSVSSVLPSTFPHMLDLAEEAINEMTVDGSYYGISCKKGRQDVLEDTHKAVPDLRGDPGQAFFGVFDGHGGRKAADFAAEHLVHKINDAIDSSQEGEGSIEAAVRSGYLATDAEFLQQGVRSGASCVTAIMKDGHMVVANAGDCRAVLSRAGTAEALTSDHRAGREDERQRIESLGGFVDNFSGTWRVQGTLAVSRGIGDLHLKEWISAEPEVQKLQITPDCEFLVLASDGLWDAVANQEVVDTARTFLQSERMKAEVMDLQIPLAMASSSLSKEDEEPVVEIGDESQGIQNKGQKDLENFPDTQETIRSLLTTDDDEVDICKGTIDGDMPNVGFPEPPLPSIGPAAACKKLVEMAVQRGCHDDISVLIVDLQHFQKNTGFVSASS